MSGRVVINRAIYAAATVVLSIDGAPMGTIESVTYSDGRAQPGRDDIEKIGDERIPVNNRLARRATKAKARRAVSYHNGPRSYAWRRDDGSVYAGQTFACATLGGEWTAVEPYTHWSLGNNWTVKNSAGDIRYMNEGARKAGAWTLIAEPVRR